MLLLEPDVHIVRLREHVAGGRGNTVDEVLEGNFVVRSPRVFIRHRSSGLPPAGNDDGFTERLLIFLLADRMHRPQLRQQFVD